MDHNDKKVKSHLKGSILVNSAEYADNTAKLNIPEKKGVNSQSLQFENPSYNSDMYKTHRWKLGSQIGSVSQAKNQDFRKLKYLHQSISSKENKLSSKTIKRNMHFSSLLVQWFPEPLIDQSIAELHKTDCSKVVADESVMIRILGYIEALLRFRCRTIPWKTLFEINEGLGMNIDKNQIAAAKFKAVSSGAFREFYQKRGSKDTFDVIRFQMARLIADLDVSPNPQTQKKEILTYCHQLSKFLEKKKIVPKDPEIYGHAIVELGCKKVLKTRNLRTLDDPRLKKKLSTAIHYIKKQGKKK